MLPLNLQPEMTGQWHFPSWVRVFATCVTMVADDEQREEYVRILTKASREITAANICHLK